MKVLMINGSPRKESNTGIALAEMQQVFEEAGVEVETVQVGAMDVRGCVACMGCTNLQKCVFDDVVNELAEKFEQADGLVVGSPVYFASANATVTAVLDRLFYSAKFNKTMKVGAAIAVARRGGTTATWDQLNKYFAFAGMPIASGQYWSAAHGRLTGEASQDAEGMQQMRTLARNMTFLMKSIELGKQEFGIPEREPGVQTNMIR